MYKDELAYHKIVCNGKSSLASQVVGRKNSSESGIFNKEDLEMGKSAECSNGLTKQLKKIDNNKVPTNVAQTDNMVKSES